MKSPAYQAKRLVIISVIKEMQAELDTFFRSKKSKKVKLSSEDVLYLEVMLAQAIGANPKPKSPVRGSPESMISGFAQRFLQEFFTLKTKPQVQLKESTFKIVKSMVDHTVSRALNQVTKELNSTSSSNSNGSGTDDEAIVYETDEDSLITTDTEIPSSVTRSSSCASGELTSSSSSSDSDVKQEESPEVSIFQTEKPRYVVRSRLLRSRRCKPSASGSGASSSSSCEDLTWLSRGPVSPLRVSPQSPLNRDRVSIGSLCSPSSNDEQAVVAPRRLPIKKRRSSAEAVVPDLRGNNPSPNMPEHQA